MEKIFTEENGNFMIDCSNALWATDKLYELYHAAKCSLSDVDWILETDGKIVLVEYKNASVAGAHNPEAFKQKEEKVIKEVREETNLGPIKTRRVKKESKNYEVEYDETGLTEQEEEYTENDYDD